MLTCCAETARLPAMLMGAVTARVLSEQWGRRRAERDL